LQLFGTPACLSIQTSGVGKISNDFIMSPGKGKCYVFVDESFSADQPRSDDSTSADVNQLVSPETQASPRRRRSFVATLMKKSRLRNPAEVVEISVAEQQRTQPVEIPDADLIIISWDAANGDGGRGSDQTLQFFATEGRS
jgi:hypothetical protein